MIEELFGDRLEAAGVALSPVHGHRHHAGLLEMQLLLQGTSTPIAALLDGVAPEEIQRIRRNAQYRERMLQVSDERGTVARIVKAEIAYEREVEILTIGEADIFDVLDETAIRDVCSKRFPQHEIAQREFQRAGGGNAARRKQFYFHQYGVAVTPKSLRRVAATMREAGKIPSILETLVDQVERLALAAAP